ncbi:hypothetical protein H312_02967 [Anncaliia algerae PRA339]|uniref:Phosphoribulokinase/uridine kinase domain-containing protein n=1 Tax=Anncaliia algerae PRA339 TaxID=1288291 RepID=A0A059EY60_9MICR|nr:hypothetical protein H312_02967 [Anncaliia algerae PRA339]
MDLIKNFNSNNILVICVQGPSCSGKSSLIKKVEKFLPNFTKINLDDYFTTKRKSNFYNYDDPSGIKWIELLTLIRDILNQKSILSVYSYDFKTSQSHGPFSIEHNKSQYLIIEGVYAYYPFAKPHIQKKFFNKMKQFKCKIINGKLNIRNVRDESTFVLDYNFSLISILLTSCKEIMIYKKVKRDPEERNITEKCVKAQIKYNTWPATNKYVLSCKEEFDFLIEHGIYNESAIDELLEALRSALEKKVYNFKEIKYFCNFCKKQYISKIFNK